MLKKALRRIKDGIKFIVPMDLYLSYYSKKHSDYYRELMEIVEAPEEYKNDSDIMKDYFKCLGKYGLPVRYYKELRFYGIKDKEQRETFIGPGRLYAVWYGVNSGPSRPYLDDKVSYLKHFSKFLNREWIDMRNVSYPEFKAFCECHSKMIVKRAKSFGGKGTFVFEYCPDKENELRGLYDECHGKECVIEEYINQKGFLHDLNPSSVNCCRVCTMRTKDDVKIFQCFATMGIGNMCVDNASAGGLFAPIDVETGVIKDDPVDELWHPFHEHPVSGMVLKGRTVPHWDKVKETVLKAADTIPDILYVSWDVAVSEDGTIYLVEGNSCGDGMWERDGGEWPVIRDAIKSRGLWLKYCLTYNFIVKYHIKELMSYLKTYDEDER